MSVEEFHKITRGEYRGASDEDVRAAIAALEVMAEIACDCEQRGIVAEVKRP